METRSAKVLFLLSIGTLLSSCKSAPLIYAPENLYPKATPKKVVVYFLRPSVEDAASLKKIVSEVENGEPIRLLGVLGDGTYFVHERPAGPSRFAISDVLSDEGPMISAFLEQGKTYYVSYYVQSVRPDVSTLDMPEFNFDFVDPIEGEALVRRLKMVLSPSFENREERSPSSLVFPSQPERREPSALP